MVVDGSRHKVESRPQVNNPADCSNQNGTSASGFSSFLFLLLSIPVAPDNLASSTNAEDTSLSPSAQFGGNAPPIGSVPGDGAAVSGRNGVQAENDQAVANKDLQAVPDSAQTIFEPLSPAPLPADIEPQGGVAGQALQSAKPNHEITSNPAVSGSPALTNFVATLASSDETLAAEDNSQLSRGTPQPLSGGSRQASPAQHAVPNRQSEPAPPAETAEPQITMMKPTEIMDQPERAGLLQNRQLEIDPKQLKPFVVLEPSAGKVDKGPAPAVEEARGKPAVQPGKETVASPVATEGSLNDLGADNSNGHLQTPLESKEEKKVYGLEPFSAKTSNGEFNTMVGDKTSHEAPETARGAVQRSTDALPFVVKPAMVHEALSAAVDAPVKPWRPVVERVAAEMVGRIKLNKQDAIIQLDPPELGKIKIDLHMDGDKLEARIFAEARESQSLIENHLQELRQALQANHVDLTDVRIQGWHGTSGDAMQSFPQQQQQQTSRQEWTWGPGNIADGEAVEAQLNGGSRQDEGRVSMWA